MASARIGILADDLTGASDTGLQFREAGLRTWVLTQLPAKDGAAVPAEVQALSLNLGTRHLDARQSFARTQQGLAWLRQEGCASFYLKVDSTLRGHVAEAVVALRREVGSDLAVVAPAFPQAGRLTIGGYQLVEGIPVGLSSYALDPLAPVTQSHLPTMLAETGERVGLIELRTVLAGWEAIAGELARMRVADVRLVVVDAARPDDLKAIATAIQHAPYMVLPVGSAGLANALCDPKPPHLLFAPKKRHLLGSAPPVLVVNGSANPVSLAQLRHLAQSTRVVEADVRQLVLTDADELERLARQILQSLLGGQDVVLTPSQSVEQVRRDQQLGAALGLSAWQMGHHLAQMLARVVRRVVDQGEVANLVLVGGETAGAVCARLPGDRVEILEAVLPAVPCGLVVGTGLRIVTKSGGFGAPDALSTIVTHLRGTGREDESLRPRIR